MTSDWTKWSTLPEPERAAALEQTLAHIRNATRGEQLLAVAAAVDATLRTDPVAREYVRMLKRRCVQALVWNPALEAMRLAGVQEAVIEEVEFSLRLRFQHSDATADLALPAQGGLF
jgi:hypothetical protein